MLEIFKTTNNNILLKIDHLTLLPISYTGEKNKGFICPYTTTVFFEKVDLYELIFNDEDKNRLISFEKYVPKDIVINCMKCSYYSSCKYDKKFLKIPNEANNILKEYKNFIKSLREDDKNGIL